MGMFTKCYFFFFCFCCPTRAFFASFVARSGRKCSPRGHLQSGRHQFEGLTYTVQRQAESVKDFPPPSMSMGSMRWQRSATINFCSDSVNPSPRHLGCTGKRSFMSSSVILSIDAPLQMIWLVSISWFENESFNSPTAPWSVVLYCGIDSRAKGCFVELLIINLIWKLGLKPESLYLKIFCHSTLFSLYLILILFTQPSLHRSRYCIALVNFLLPGNSSTYVTYPGPFLLCNIVSVTMEVVVID